MENAGIMGRIKLRIFILWGIWTFSVISCTKDQAVLRVGDVETGSCKNGSLKSVIPGYPESLAYKVINSNFLSVKHINAVFNCCLPAGITVDAAIRHDSIVVCENEKEPGICNCICPYDVKYTLGPLDYGQYVFVLAWPDGETRTTFSFRFDRQTDGVFSIVN